MIQEGIAVDPLLAGAGWNLAMLIQTKFEKSGVARRYDLSGRMPSGISAKHNETPGSRLKSIVGMTRLMRFIWIKFIARNATLALGLVWAKRHDVSGCRPLLTRVN